MHATLIILCCSLLFVLPQNNFSQFFGVCRLQLYSVEHRAEDLTKNRALSVKPWIIHYTLLSSVYRFTINFCLRYAAFALASKSIAGQVHVNKRCVKMYVNVRECTDSASSILTWISGFETGFLDFKMDFWISKWISGFQSGFLDFKWISGFQNGFLDFKMYFWISEWISDFTADFWISNWISAEGVRDFTRGGPLG